MLNDKDFEVIMKDKLESGKSIYREGLYGDFDNAKTDFHFCINEVPEFSKSRDLNYDVEVNRFGTEEELLNGEKSIVGSLSVPKYLKVFFQLMDLSNEHSVVHITQQELADMLKYSRATINVYMKYLRDNKYIIDTARQGQYILNPKYIVKHINEMFLLYFTALTSDGKKYNKLKEEQGKSLLKNIEFTYKLKYYTITKNLNYAWPEFEEEFKEQLEDFKGLAFVPTPFIPIKNSDSCKIKNGDEVFNKNSKYTYCTFCRNKVGKDWIYCSKCGHKIERVEDLEEREENIKVSENEMSNEEKCLTSDLSHLVDIANSVESDGDKNIEDSKTEEMSTTEKNLTDDILTLIDKANKVDEEDVLTEKEKRLITLVATMVRKQVEYEYESKNKE